METILVALIILQAVLMFIGYLALARQVGSTRKRLEVLGSIAALLPLLGLIFAILPSGVATNELLAFIEFYIYSIIANAVIGGIAELIENVLPGRKQYA